MLFTTLIAFSNIVSFVISLFAFTRKFTCTEMAAPPHPNRSRSRNRRRWPALDINNEPPTDDDCSDDNDLELQGVLYNSAQLHNYSREQQPQNPSDVKKKGIDTSCRLVKINGRINLQNSKYEKGEPSCVYCTICNEPRPVPNDTMKRGGCGHVYCKECIINYVRERIKENPTEVDCPVTDCKQKIVITDYFVPREFRNHWRDTVREVMALASCDIIVCPFLDCLGYLIDDKKGFLIRACPKCWILFCVRCGVYWHMGMDCETYQRRRKIILLDDDEEDDK